MRSDSSLKRIPFFKLLKKGKQMNHTKAKPMNQYLLSTYAVEGEVPGAPTTPEEGQAFMERVIALETAMDASRTFVFGGALQLVGPDIATVVSVSDGKVAMSDSPTTKSKEQIAGFYIINADDLDAAQAWARKVASATNHPIEVRPFRATGRLGE
jgi:hypothetical protein